MSELAPFVAATLRDKIVKELHEDNQELRNEICQLRKDGRSWTVQIAGPGGSPVYCTGKISDREVLQQISNQGENLNRYAEVIMHGGEGFSCPLESFLECQLILTNGLGLKIIETVGTPTADIGGGIRAHHGRLEIHWWFFANSTVFASIALDAPIPPDEWDDIDPALVEGRGDVCRRRALPIAEEVAGSDAPIRFVTVNLNSNMLVAPS
mmetsp:Transcript_25792/g.28886  ORF Transcript_25792/g.28886 Transcript_25792/m.28886 type:complete len:210 (+) Transcript_25792:19-648(+)